jgi:hypothetical protein
MRFMTGLVLHGNWWKTLEGVNHLNDNGKYVCTCNPEPSLLDVYWSGLEEYHLQRCFFANNIL